MKLKNWIQVSLYLSFTLWIVSCASSPPDACICMPNRESSSLPVSSSTSLSSSMSATSSNSTNASVSSSTAAVPSSSSQEAKPVTYTRYIVRPGDSLAKIAHFHGTTVDKIREANKLTTDILPARKILLIPKSQSNK